MNARLSPILISNDGASLLTMARKHRGIVLLPTWRMNDYLRRKELVALELDQSISLARHDKMGIYMLYLPAPNSTSKIRLAVDFLYQRLANLN
ncbi:hypothetical protein BVH03_22665 [Pseudomonas sp. PA15(2017)]|uniref:LysR substrate-binding domain-containing protein n=1 Tax=Pseudomonas sp. PA15(2017) TaxID=1932111 RepID=UPI000962FBAA|nr:hypothetical protein BVH03_22665 [Pseudomonas sp. PA15(2017)]